MKQVFDVPDISPCKVRTILSLMYPKMSYSQSISTSYPTIKFASIMFELGLWCDIKVGDATLELWDDEEVIDYFDIGKCCYWVGFENVVIDINQGIMTEFDNFGSDSIICWLDDTKIIKQSPLEYIINSCSITYRPYLYRESKAILGNNYCRSNRTLYRDLNVSREFLETTKLVANECRTIFNSK